MNRWSALVVWLVAWATAGAARANAEGLTRLMSGTTSRLTVIGWSADERFAVVRVFSLLSPEEPTAFCAGYVDDKGKPFLGSLAFFVLEGSTLSARLPIQDGTDVAGKREDGCTPPGIASQRLAAAKKKLAAMGVDLGKPGILVDGGAPSAPEISVLERLDHGAVEERSDGKLLSIVPPGQTEPQTVKLDAWWKTMETPGGGTVTTLGTFALRQGEQVVKRVKTSATNTGNMGSRDMLRSGPVYSSPSGRRLLFFVSEEFTSGRGDASVPYLFGAFEWQGALLVAR